MVVNGRKSESLFSLLRLKNRITVSKVNFNRQNGRVFGNVRRGPDALRGDGVPLTNAQAGLMTPTIMRAYVAVELILCVRIKTQEVFVQ